MFKFLEKNKLKVSTLLFRNYIGICLLFLFIVFSSLMTLVLFIVNSVDFSNPYISASSFINKDFSSIDISKIEAANGWVELLDENYNIIDKKGVDPYKKTRYTKGELLNLLINDDVTTYSQNLISIPKHKNRLYRDVAYDRDSNKIIIVNIPSSHFNKLIYKNSVISKGIIIKQIFFFYTILFLFITILFAKKSSKYFLTPLNKLTTGVKSLSTGDYSTRISLDAENEFGELRDAFNYMAFKIQEERRLKESAEESRKRIIMDISHDLKTPLSSIIGFSDYLMKNANLSEEEKKHYLNIIIKNANRADTLIKDLFEFSKYESLEYKLELCKLDICEFLRELVALYIPVIEDNEFDFDVDIPENPIFVNFDKKGMDRAISNLINNSIKYNGPGTKLFIGLMTQDDKILITLKDDGIGIPRNLTYSIFDPFTRVDSTRNSNTGGTGLGLAISKKIIIRHNGNIDLWSDTGKGCEFIISLPKAT